MQFSIKARSNPNWDHYTRSDIDISREFSKLMIAEFGEFLRGIVLFGSLARKRKEGQNHDIDILVIVDDVRISLSSEIVEAYRIMTQNFVTKISNRLHVITMRLSSFWEYIRVGDPIAINILRDGFPLLDTGFFEPFQMLLFQGRIRPSLESIWTHYLRAPKVLENSRSHVRQATVDLYWACMDAAHAALMSYGQTPPSPEHVGEMLDEVFVRQGLLEKRYSEIMQSFYRLMKMIEHRKIDEVSGREFDAYFKSAEDFVTKMHSLIDKNKFSPPKHLKS